MQFLKFSKYKSNVTTLCFVLFFTFFFSNRIEINAQKKYTVVLDAGHGGKDPGNLGNGYKEKKIALKVVLEVGKQLTKNKDIDVIYTRDKDVFIELHNRAKIANDNKADLFVSIHCDSYTNPRAHGAGTFVLGLSGNKQNLEMAKRENAVILLEDNYQQNYDYDPNSPESVISLSMLQADNLDESLEFADLVQDNFSVVKRFDRSVKQNNFLVLRETVMPSVLIELGFLTNKAEGKFLNSKTGQLRMANAITKAIEKYFERLQLNTLEEKKASSIAKTTPAKKEEKKPEVVASVEHKRAYERRKVPGKPSDKKEIKTPKTTPKTATVTKKEPKKISKEIVVTGKRPPKTKEKEPETKSSGKIEFKVQIAASRRSLTDGNFNFRGLKNVEVLVIDEYFKYYYGGNESFTKVKEALKKARSAGHKDAFIVAFKDGVKIPLREALKKQ
ncbi:N-acetylmuramoyl-L-alanine amidase family protein [Tenacibaculum amylolyticum]|uniref:N-acetylmuramoyl-L-alanine amidase family protein n=1 Tax=Tenacibaculum amylolyticum TaxID=104269 RepID=UPI00389348AC